MSIFVELKRRNVFRVAAAYVVVSWLFVQGLELAADSFEAPAWVMKMIITFIALGFIPTLLFSWAFEITPEGIKRERDVDRSSSIVDHTGRKLDFITLAAAAGVAGLFVWQQFSSPPTPVALPAAAITAAGNELEIETPDELPTSESADAQSIAVLPFANMANDPENEPFTVGIHDDLLTNLSKIRALKVISRTSVLRYKDTRKPIGEIARELDVATILEGGVQRYGNQIRINVQLIDAATDEHLWAEKYDRQLTAANIFEIQSEISGHIAAALKTQLTPEEVASLEHKPTDNLDAYNAYLAGRQRMLKRSSESLEAALGLFSRAIELDSNFALAYVGKADVYGLLEEYSDVTYERMMAEGEPLVQKALALNPQLAEAHTSLAAYQQRRNDLAEAEESFKKALALNPNYATTYHWYGLMLRNIGRAKEALVLHRRAAVLDPYSPVIQANVGWSLNANGMHKKALAQFIRTHELDPEFPGALAGIGTTYKLLGKLDEGIIWKRKVIALDPGNLNQRVGLAFNYLDLGDFSTARKLFEEAEQLAPDHDSALIGRVFMDINGGDLDKAHERLVASRARSGGNSFFIEDTYAWSNMLQGDYQTAIDSWHELYPGDQPGTFDLGLHSFDRATGLAWSLKKIGQTRESGKLVADALALIENTPTLDRQRLGYEKVSLLAIKGDAKAAAEEFAAAVDAGVRSGWWLIKQLPWMSEVRDSPVYKQAWQRMMDDLKAQRQRLAQHDAKELTT